MSVKVAVFRGVEATVGGEGVSFYGDAGGKRIPVYANSDLVVKSEKSGISVNGTVYNSFFIDSKGSLIRVNGKGYRGRMEVVREGTAILLINEINIEEYLVGLINHEISSKWHPEAVKAQAVVARTYALYQKKVRKNPLYDLESTVTSQVYGGADGEDELAFQAVKETEGEVVYYNGELIQALYHSSCGGKTEAAKDVWGKDVPYLNSVRDEHCTEAPNYFWQYQISAGELSGRLQRIDSMVGKIDSVSISARTPTGRVAKVTVKHSGGILEIAGKELREALGLENIRSTDFIVKPRDGGFYFGGSGGGHGVGMCQWGAKGMAEDGKKYRDILKWYYPGITIRRYY